MKEKELQYLILCQCHNAEHQMIIRTIEGDENAYVTIHLKPLPFFKRLKHAIKYLFGYRCRFGNFDEFILDSSDAPTLEYVVKYLKTNHNSIR